MRRIKIYLIYGFIFFFPLEYSLEILFGVVTIFKPYRLMGLILILVALQSNSIITKKPFSMSINSLWLFIFTYSLLLSSFQLISNPTIDLSKSINMLILISFSYLCYLSIIGTKLTIKNIEYIFIALGVGVTVTIIYSILNIDIASHAKRQHGLFRNATSLGTSSAVVTIFWIWFLLEHKLPLLKRIIYFSFAGIAVFGLLLSGTRAALLEVLSGLCIFLFFHRKRTAVLKLVIISSLPLIFSLFYFNLISYFSEIFWRYKFEFFLDNPRLDIWKAALSLGKQYAFFGIGPNQYANYHKELILLFSTSSDHLLYEYDLGIHNNFISLLVEFGFPCLIAYSIFMFKLYKGLFRITFLKSAVSGYAVLLIAILTAQNIEGLFRSSLDCPQFWLVMALAVTLIENHKRFQIPYMSYRKKSVPHRIFITDNI